MVSMFLFKLVIYGWLGCALESLEMPLTQQNVQVLINISMDAFQTLISCIQISDVLVVRLDAVAQLKDVQSVRMFCNFLLSGVVFID